MAETFLRPSAKWAQRRDTIYLTITVAETKNVHIDVNSENLLLITFVDKRDVKYKFEIELFESIDLAKSEWKNKRFLEVKLVKSKDGFWKSLYTGKKIGNITVDWDRFVDGDDSDDEDDVEWVSGKKIKEEKDTSKEDETVDVKSTGNVKEEEETGGEEKLDIAKLQKEFRSCRVRVEMKDFSLASSRDNLRKNRYSVFPYDHNAVFVEGRYVNASDCLVHRMKYIACQYPLLSYQEVSDGYDFWNMIQKHEVNVIVSLQKANYKHPVYWPSEMNKVYELSGHESKTKDLSLRLKSIKESESFDTVECELIVKKISEEEQEDSTDTRPVSVILFKVWPDMDVPDRLESMYDLLNEVDRINNVSQEPYSNFEELFDKCNFSSNKNEKDEDEGELGVSDTCYSPPKVLAHCSAGIGRTGVLLLCHSILRNKKLGIEDIPSVLKILRKER